MHDARSVFRRTAGWSSLFAAITLVGSLPAALQAQTPDCATLLCPGTVAPTPCTVTGTISPVAVTPGWEIDCTGRDVVVNGFGRIDVDDGYFTLKADTLLIDDGGIISATEVVIGTGQRGFRLDISGSVDIDGSLQATGDDGGGDITVVAGGDLNITNLGNKGVEADGTNMGASGGSIELTSTGGAVNIANPIRANSHGSGEAGGGRIAIRAATDVAITTTSARLHVDSHKSDAGSIRITSGGDITIGAGTSLSADGHNVAGNGGGVYITAGNAVTIDSKISARGGVGSGGNEAAGGSVHIESGCGGVSISADMDIRGGEFGGGYDGGALAVETLGDLTVASGVKIETHAVGNGGSGGDVLLEAGGKLDLLSNVLIDTHGDATDPDGDGLGGAVTLSGCDVDVAASASIDATGREGGAIAIRAASRAANVTTLHLAGTSSFNAAGATSADDGEIEVAVVKESLTGYCAYNNAIPCTLDADCTVGCTPGDCDALNPDTDDVLTQFLSTTDMREERNLTGCSQACAP